MAENNPNFVERRLTMLLMGYWEELRRDRAYVAVEDFQSSAIMEIWDECFILLADRDGAAGRFEHLGGKIALSSGVSPEIRSAAEVPPNTVLAKALGLAPEVFGGNFPLLDSGEITDVLSRNYRYRIILVPLCNSEGAVVKLIGGGSRKLVS